MHARTKHRGKSEQIKLHNRDFRFALLKDYCPGTQLTLLTGGGPARADASRDGQQRIRRDDRFADTDL